MGHRKMNKLAIALACLALAAVGCKKDKKADDPVAGSNVASGSATGSDMAGSGTAAGSGTMAGSGSNAASTDTADKLEVFADHKDPKKGPVTVTFTGIKVVEAKFDPEKLEGGTATLEVDVGTLASGNSQRDDHLKSEDYLELAKFPAVTITIDNVKQAGDAYTADATVKSRGVEKKVPVTFTVADKGADWVRVNGEAKFSRLDFKVGKPEDDKEEGTKAEMTAKLQVTLKKS